MSKYASSQNLDRQSLRDVVRLSLWDLIKSAPTFMRFRLISLTDQVSLSVRLMAGMAGEEERFDSGMTMWLAMAVLLALGGFSPPCSALHVYPLVDQQRTEIPISKDTYTRIAVEEDRIQQIFGVEGVFDIESDEEQGQIFLKLVNPHLKKPVSLSIVTEGGLTQDLKLIPQEGDAQSILFKPSLVQKTEPTPKSYKARLLDLITAIGGQTSLEGYEQKPLKACDRKVDPSLNLEPLRFYEGDRYEGRAYKVTNLSLYPLTLSEDRLYRQGDVAISVSQLHLHPQQGTCVIIISKKGGRG